MNEEKPVFNGAAAASLVNPQDVITYFQKVFGSVSWDKEKNICLRGIGEKGTDQEGIFRSDNFFQPAFADPTDGILNCVDLWARNQIACFVVPAILRAQKGTSENISLFTNILADLDSGNTDEKLEYMTKHIGAPSMVIRSGGTTAEGTPKRHVYYILNDPSEDIKRAVTIRDQLARKCGGDISMGLGVDGNPFGRAHQPVRVPGSVHSKNGIANPCSIESLSENTYDIESLASMLEAMPASPWAVEIPQTGKPIAERIQTGSLFDINSGGNGGGTAAEALHEKVYEGGSDRTRFGEFNKVAGLHISMARRGEITVQRAFDDTAGWVLACMVPPWPAARIEHEFSALLSHDIRQHGPMPEPEKPIVEEAQKISEGGLGLKAWAAHRWVTEPKPEHSFIVKDLVIRGEPHLFVAQGGAGKTFQVADLAMKIASFSSESNTKWCGQQVVAGGTAVLILCEDSQTEMHRRLLEINSDERIKKAGDKLIVLPMTKLGGAFPLVEMDYRTGESRPSKRWAEMLSLLREIHDLSLVCIDTLNSVSHGDENSALAISQMMREAHRVCGELGAALVINHHIRKQGKDQQITSLEDLSSAIRGSSAISSYFRINFGMFACTDYDRRMKSMGLKPERGALWRFGVCKANIHGLMRGEKTLLRNKRGLMDDVTHLDIFQGDNKGERTGWLILACREAAERGHPYSNGTKGSSSGLYRRRAELPPSLRNMGQHELESMLNSALQSGSLTTCAVRGSKGKQFIDIPTGPLASDEAGGVLSAGAYIDTPDWSAYTFCETQGSVVKRSDVKKPFTK
jgi:hypothetical protein